MRTTIKRPPAELPGEDDKRVIGDAIATITAGYERPLRVRWNALTDAESRDLVDLTRKADQPDGFGIGRLDERDRRRWEHLAEKGAGRPGLFEDARAAADLRRLGAELRRDAQAPARRVRLEQPGSVTLPKEWCWDYLASGALWPAHLAMLLYLLAGWENGALPVESSSATLDGETIRVDLRRGHLLPDPGGNFVEEESLLDHLALSDFVELTKRGRTWEVRPGSRLRAARKAA